MKKKHNILNILLNPKKEILTELRSDERYRDYMKHVKIFGKGGSSVIYKDTRTGHLIKQQKLYQQNPSSNHDFYRWNGTDCMFIKESFLLESLIMENLSKISILIPGMFDVLIGKDKGIWYSLMIMKKQMGISYTDFVKSTTLRNVYISWYHFVQELELLFNSCRFLHGDLITNNMFVDYGEIRLIDFGLSMVKLDGVFFLREHVVPRILKLSSIKKISMNHIKSIDICKLLYRHDKFSKSFQKLMDSCQGINGKRSITKSYFPNPVYIHHPDLSFEKAIHELKRRIDEMK